MKLINGIAYLDVQEFTTSSGNNNDVAIYSSILYTTCTADNDTITGAIPPNGESGALLWIVNASASNTLLIANNSASSTSGYRFLLGSGSTTLTLEADQGQLFVFVSGTGWKAIRSGTFT